MSAMDRAVCLVSGGLDSCVAVACAARDGLAPALLHVRYGQRTEIREREAFERIAEFYSVDQRLVCELSLHRQIGGSALTDTTITLPRGELERRDIPITYVPFRNGTLLALAASWAEVLGAHSVYIGAVDEDSSGYPDCRPGFFEAMNAAIHSGTRPESSVTIRTPLISLSKAAIIELGVSLGAPLELTWSCYREGASPCGECDSCLLRQRGFEQSGLTDPASQTDAPERGGRQ